MRKMIVGAGLLAVVGGCARTVQAWPPPFTQGTNVHVHFDAPRVVVFERGPAKDTVEGIRDLRGTALALRGDTLTLSVARVSGDAGETTISDRRAMLALDQSTVITVSEVDGWKLGYALLAGTVLIFAVAVLSGS